METNDNKQSYATKRKIKVKKYTHHQIIRGWNKSQCSQESLQIHGRIFWIKYHSTKLEIKSKSDKFKLETNEKRMLQPKIMCNVSNDEQEEEIIDNTGLKNRWIQNKINSKENFKLVT